MAHVSACAELLWFPPPAMGDITSATGQPSSAAEPLEVAGSLEVVEQLSACVMSSMPSIGRLLFFLPHGAASAVFLFRCVCLSLHEERLAEGPWDLE